MLATAEDVVAGDIPGLLDEGGPMDGASTFPVVVIAVETCAIASGRFADDATDATWYRSRCLFPSRCSIIEGVTEELRATTPSKIDGRGAELFAEYSTMAQRNAFARKLPTVSSSLVLRHDDKQLNCVCCCVWPECLGNDSQCRSMRPITAMRVKQL